MHRLDVNSACQAKRGQLQHATDRQADCLRIRAEIADLEAKLAEQQRRSEGKSSILQEQTRNWLTAVKALEQTCDEQYVTHRRLNARTECAQVLAHAAVAGQGRMLPRLDDGA